MEAPAILPHRPASAWPDQGVVAFDGYSTRYREGMDLVIKGVTVRIKPREKVRAVMVVEGCCHNGRNRLGLLGARGRVSLV